MSVSPFVPPRSVDLPPAGGLIGPKPEHFLVEEIPAYPLSGEGEHVFLWVEKRGITTPEVAKRIARAASARERDVGYAGLKDKNAVARQWFSLCTKETNPGAWDLGEGAIIVKATRHQNKLRTGHLHGNCFTITLVGSTEGATARAEAIAEALTRNGLVNYFGPQRFGYAGRNLAQALEWLNTAGPKASAEDDSAHHQETDRRVEGKRRRPRKKPGGRFENKMLPSVLQSEIFNRYASARVQMPDELLLGEVVRLNDSGKHFVVEELEKELPRFRAGDLHITGPMIGPKTLCGQHAALALEEKIESELGLTPEQLELLGREAPGARRDLFLYPQALAIESGGDGELAISFSLPSGSYATQIIREFTGADWESPRG
jgi:tRNA pseudouridine13 synthase